MKATIEKFFYNGTGVTFETRNGITYVNATEIAKHFNKQPAHWLRTQAAAVFIQELSGMRKCIASDLVLIINGDNGGTWMHEDVALEFSRWLSPSFAIWCNDRIKELMQHGITATQPTIENILSNPEFGIELLTQIKKEREEKAQLYRDLEQKDKTIEIKEGQLKIQAPAVKYVKDVLNSDSLIATTVIGKDLGFSSAIQFNKDLIAKKIICAKKVNGCYVLHAKYAGQGYAHTKTHNYVDNEGKTKTSRLLYWTEKGRMFLEYIYSNWQPQ